MFGIKTKEVKVQQEVMPEVKKVEKVFSLEELDLLYESRRCQSLDLDDLDLNLSGKKLDKLRFMQKCERAGFSPFTPNLDWYAYRIAGSWKSSSTLNCVSTHHLVYAYPLPLKATNAIEKIWGTLPNTDSTPEIYLMIISANPNLGILPDKENSRAVVNVDPILMLTIQFEDRKYYYHLAQWDLKIDLGQM